MRIYSPSRTEDFLFCPAYYMLKHVHGWQPATYGKPEIAMALGRGVGAGLSFYYTHDRLGVPVPPLADGLQPPVPDAAVRVGLAATDAALAELDATGRVCISYAQEDLDHVRPRVTRAIARIIERDPIPRDWTILGTEVTLPDHGYCKIDLPVRDPKNLAVVDFKTKRYIRADQLTKERRELAHKWQQLHYAWAYGEAMGEQVTRFWIMLVVLEPKFDVHFWPYDIHPEHLKGWIVSARQTWADMDATERGERPPVQRPNHFDKYGACEFYDACFTYHYDEGAMVQDYIQVKRK